MFVSEGYDKEVRFTSFRENVLIRSLKLQQLMIIKSNKLSFYRYDNNSFVLEDQIYTKAHGHYYIK